MKKAELNLPARAGFDGCFAGDVSSKEAQLNKVGGDGGFPDIVSAGDGTSGVLEQATQMCVYM